MDGHLAEAHAVLAKIHSDEWNWTDAESGYFFAISLDPNDPTAHQWYSALLVHTGRLDEALEEAHKAYELDRTSPVLTAHLATAYLKLGESEKALELAQQSEELGIAEDLSGLRGFAYFRSGDLDAAVEAFASSPQLKDIPASGIRDWLFAAQDPEAAQALLEQIRESPPEALDPSLALMFYIMLGDLDRAFDIAEGLADEKRLPLGLLWEPESRALRQDPRMQTLAQRTGLVDYWRQYGWPDQCQPSGDGFTCSG